MVARRVNVCCVVLTVLLFVAGCSPTRGRLYGRGRCAGDWRPQTSRAGRYLEGFMAGYAAAQPEGGFERRPHGYPARTPYRQGWRNGYHTGAKDAEQRE